MCQLWLVEQVLFVGDFVFVEEDLCGFWVFVYCFQVYGGVVMVDLVDGYVIYCQVDCWYQIVGQGFVFVVVV